MKECYLYKKLPQDKIQCQVCWHYCLIDDEKTGKCGIRKNEQGKLFLMTYGKPCSIAVDPIEKKPLFHFLPGTETLSIATVGCNFSCLNCQNYDISQAPKSRSLETTSETRTLIPPQRIVELALERKTPSISYTYTEPTVFLEYALDIMKLAKKANLKNIWVSNGYFSPQTLKLILPHLDTCNIDLKGFTEEFYQKVCGAHLQPILENLKAIKKAGVWLEITTLAIPGLSDSKEMFEKIAEFIKNELSPETPWHISGFSGAISWKLKDTSNTPLSTLQIAHSIGKKTGLKYVYAGNMPGTESEDTFCPKCNAKMIERNGYFIKRFDKNGKCAKCGQGLNLILK